MIPLRVHHLLLFLLPVLAVHTCLWISIRSNHIETSIPYIDGAVSISKACRQPVSIWLFRCWMVVYGILLLLFWQRNLHSQRPWISIGLLGVGCLVLYTFTLGNQIEWLKPIRRIGAFGTFSAILLCQCRITWTDSPKILGRVIVNCVSILIALLFVASDFLFDRGEWENICEWWLALAINCWFLIGAWHSQIASLRTNPDE